MAGRKYGLRDREGVRVHLEAMGHELERGNCSTALADLVAAYREQGRQPGTVSNVKLSRARRHFTIRCIEKPNRRARAYNPNPPRSPLNGARRRKRRK